MGQAELLGVIRRHPIWRRADERTVRALSALVDDRRVPAGEAILSAGGKADRIHLLVEGAARVYYPATADGAEITVKLFWAPAAFGDAESVLRLSWAETVEALTYSRVLVIEAGPYFRLMQRDPSLCFRQYWDGARRFGVAIRSERSANLVDLVDRVIALLVAYANHFGVPDGGGLLIDHPLTQEAIAKQVGLKRRSVVDVLGRLYDSGVLVRVGRRYLVPDLTRLLRASRSAAPDLSFRTDEQPWAEPSGG